MEFKTIELKESIFANNDREADRLRAELNTLGIGPMGYGGRTTVLAVHLGELWRHPASFFVSISYMCWSSRRTTLRIGADGTAVFE